jgi:hypothetical protein
MAGYSTTPLWKKLGYKSGLTAYLEDAPDSYIDQLQLPADVNVKWVKKPTARIDFVHLFTASRAHLETRLQSLLHSIAPAGMIWISWPKKASGVPSEVTEDLVREIALPLGFVDVKVCAVDEVWSALKLVVRKANR